MTEHLTRAIALVKTITLLMGFVVTYLALKAYRRTRAPALRAVAVGFAVVTLGAVLGGVAHQLLDVSLSVGVLLQSLVTMVGFGLIVYSLYTR
jgi:hypothetical protein